MVAVAGVHISTDDLIMSMLASACHKLRVKRRVGEIWLSEDLLNESLWRLKQHPNFGLVLREVEIIWGAGAWNSRTLDRLLWNGDRLNCEVDVKGGKRVVTMMPDQTEESLCMFQSEYGMCNLCEVENLASALIRMMEICRARWIMHFL